MARPAASDPLHNFMFHVKALDDIGLRGRGGDLLQPSGVGPGFTIGDGAEAGFTQVTSPEYTVETSDYREGTKTYTEKYPGLPATADCTMSRGVARKDTAFFDWVVSAIEGADYRSDLAIYHFRRGARSVPFDPATDISDAAAKKYILRNCVPNRIKPAGDFDASTNDVSLAEVGCVYERFDIETDNAPANAGVRAPVDTNLATLR